MINRIRIRDMGNHHDYQPADSVGSPCEVCGFDRHHPWHEPARATGDARDRELRKQAVAERDELDRDARAERAILRTGNKTAAQIAAVWRARAAGLRHSDDVADLAAAIAFEQCARELMTELDGMLSG